MHVNVTHKTVYAFESPSTYSMQSLRLWPRPTGGQTVLSWSIVGNDRRELPWVTDAYGNIVHTLAVMGTHERVEVTVQGEVLTTDTTGILRDSPEPMPAPVFLRQTAMTEPSDGIRDLAETARVEVEKDRIAGLHALMRGVRKAIEYRVDATDVTTTAAEALEKGQGVCQDHSHVFISCARELGVPARYVSGYLAPDGGGGPHEASHAWAEALVEGLGWIGFDVSNDTCPTELYVRGAAGLDYRGAAPVLGVRRGGGGESLEVTVEVTATQALYQTLNDPSWQIQGDGSIQSQLPEQTLGQSQGQSLETPAASSDEDDTNGSPA